MSWKLATKACLESPWKQEAPSAPSLTTWVLMRVVKRSNGMARRRDGSMHRLLSELMEVKVKVREGEESIDGDIEPQVWARFFFLYTQVRCP